MDCTGCQRFKMPIIYPELIGHIIEEYYSIYVCTVNNWILSIICFAQCRPFPNIFPNLRVAPMLIGILFNINTRN